MTDPIADFLTRIRNAVSANHKVVEVPASNMKKAITKILYDQGFILSYKFDDESHIQGLIKIALKYHPETKISAIKGIDRVSKPGLRKYTGIDNMPRVLGGLGIAIMSTSHGLMTAKEATRRKIGGEIICNVY